MKKLIFLFSIIIFVSCSSEQASTERPIAEDCNCRKMIYKNQLTDNVMTLVYQERLEWESICPSEVNATYDQNEYLYSGFTPMDDEDVYFYKWECEK